MQPRIDLSRISGNAFKAVLGLEHYIRSSRIEASLIHLVKLRASYMNGCAYCVDMHAKDALAAGETTQRLLAVPVWRETPFFSARERAAFEWTEAVTDLAGSGVPDEVYTRVREVFPEEALVDLTMVVVAINCWNRLAVSFRAEVGSYQPAAPASAR